MFIYSFAKKKFNLNTDMGIENKNMHIEIVSIEENKQLECVEKCENSNDCGKIVVLFNGFQKKTQKTPNNEIEKALKIKEEYYGDKQSSNK